MEWPVPAQAGLVWQCLTKGYPQPNPTPPVRNVGNDSPRASYGPLRGCRCDWLLCPELGEKRTSISAPPMTAFSQEATLTAYSRYRPLRDKALQSVSLWQIEFAVIHWQGASVRRFCVCFISDEQWRL